MKVSVAVMAHPARAGMVPGLVEALDSPAQVVFDERNDRWDTGRRSMLAHDPDATHHLVVQDDAIVCRDLVAGVTEAVRHVPDNPIALYTGRVRPSQPEVRARLRRAEVAGDSWFVMQGPIWGVGIIVPVPMISPMVDACDRLRIPNYDTRMAQYFKTIGIPCFYTVPSLVDHRQDHTSLVPGRGVKGRYAHRFIGTDVSALSVDWSRIPTVGPVSFRSKSLPSRVVTVDADSKRAEQLRRMPAAWVEVG